MAVFHIQISRGAKGAALNHAQYISRFGRFSVSRYGEVKARGHANLPDWAGEDPMTFWRASDAFERANGNAYREYEVALPRELSRAAQVILVCRFAAAEFGVTRPYQWVIYAPLGGDGEECPQARLLYSDRQLDGIKRTPEQFFKRYDPKKPERGGCKKATYGANKIEAARVYEKIRERWATLQNQALERAGVAARVDHRSLVAQGILDREPGVHRGRIVNAIEARGEVSEVGQAKRAQQQRRADARARLIAELHAVDAELELRGFSAQPAARIGDIMRPTVRDEK